MRKLSYLLGLSLLSGILLFSCAKDEEEPLAPSLNFLGGVDPVTGWTRVDGDVTLDVAQPFVFGFTANSNSDKNLARVVVTRNYENISLITVIDSNLAVKTFTMDIQTIAWPNNTGTEVFEVKVTDKNDKTASITFTVTTEVADPGISEFTNISLGSYASATNSSFASITGETFSLAEANSSATVQGKIDWMYFHGATRGHSLVAPHHEDAVTIYPSVATWTNRNITYFAKTTLTVNDYTAIANKNQLVVTIQNQGLTFNQEIYSQLLSNPGGFAVGDIIAFETLSGNYGLIRVKEVNPGATNGESTIKYDIKVEKTD